MRLGFPDAMREMLRARGLSRKECAERCGRSLGALENAIHKGNPSLRVAGEYAEACGYVLAFVPVGGRLPDGSIEVEGIEGRL